MKLNIVKRGLSRNGLYLFLLSLIGLATWGAGIPVSSPVTAQGSHKHATEFVPVIGKTQAYVLREENGHTVCKEATPSESLRLKQQANVPEKLHVIYGGEDNLLRASQAQIGLRITLRGTAQLDNFPDAKAAFIRAAQNWESQILSPISIVVDVDYGTTFFGEAYNNANIIGQTSSVRIGSPTGYNDIRARMVLTASTVAEAALLNTLPAAQLPTDQGPLTSVYTGAPVFRALGLINPIADPDADLERLGPPPRIGFNSAFPFDFDPSNGISINRVDFDGVATHEIGHALGFSSSVGEKELDATISASVTLLDFFRFRPGVNATSFTTADRILASGGAHIFYAGGQELGFSTGKPDGTGGDGEQASHWKDNAVTGVYVGVMDPTAARGEREQITPNDLLAFDTIGYRVRSAQQQIDAAPRPLDFGDAALNTNVDKTLAVYNTGGQPLQITNITSSNAQFSLVSPGTSFSIPANSQQDVVLRFRPTANGQQAATLTITSNDPNRATLTVALSGFGGIQPVVALTSGVARTGTAPSSIGASCQIDATQYTIQVPTGATQLVITLSGGQDVDVYARFGSRVTGSSPSWLADHVSDSPGATETITITSSSSPALRAGTYYIGVTNCDPGSASFTLTATVTGGGGPTAIAVVSSASYRGTELTSESIASAFGTNLATGTVIAGTATLPTTMGGATVRVRDSAGGERSAPLFFVSAGQINFLIPQGTAAGAATINVVNSSNTVIATGTINIVAVAPGLFAANANGQGVAAADALRVLANNSQRYEPVARFDTATNRFVTQPIDLGPATEQVFLVLYGTGLRNRTSLNASTVQLGGTAAQVLYVGAQGSLVGLDQVNVLIPRSLIGRGEIDAVLTVDGKAANTVRVNIR